MDGLKISELPPANAASSTDQFEVNQNGVSRRVTLAQITGSDNVLDVRAYGALLDGATDDTAAAVAAVAAAAASGQTLYWPFGTALTTASIPLLHTVRHRGPGEIKRGASLFAVESLDADSNHLYVAPAGVATNDGLSPAEPTTPQAAANALVNYGPALGGTWEINFAAGNHPSVTLDNGLTGNIRFVGVPTGDFRSTPTSVIDKALSGANRFGIYYSGAGKNVFIKDIKAINFSAAGESGFRGAAHSVVTYENPHTYNCYFGITNYDFILYSVKGGILDGGSVGVYGINELFCIVRNFRAAVTHADRTTVKNFTHGLHAKELCTGHADFLQIMDCEYGFMLTRCSTANCADMDFRRNLYAVLVQSGSSIINASDIYWHGNKLTAASWAAGVVSYTFDLDEYGLGIDVKIGESFRITDSLQAGYNGTFTALTATATTATAAMAANPGTWVAGGRIDANTHRIIPTAMQIIDNEGGEGNIEYRPEPPWLGQVSKLHAYDSAVHVLAGTTELTALVYPLSGFKAGQFQTAGFETSLYAAGTYNNVGGSALAFRIGNSTLQSFAMPVGSGSWIMESKYLCTADGDVQYHSGFLAVDGQAVQVKRGPRAMPMSTTEYNFGVWGQLTAGAVGEHLTCEIARLYTTMT